MPSLPSGTRHRPRGTDGDQNCERYVPALLRSGLGLGARPPPSTWRQLRTRTHPCSSASEIFPVNRVFLSVPLQCGKRDNSNTDGFWSASLGDVGFNYPEHARAEGRSAIARSSDRTKSCHRKSSRPKLQTADRKQTAHSAPAVNP